MDIRAILTFVASHVEQIFGSTLVLFFVTSVVLLVRSIGSKDDSDSSGHTTVQIDAKQIEETIQRALSGHIAAPAGAGASGGHAARAMTSGTSEAAEKAAHDPHGSSLTIGHEGEENVQSLMAQIKDRDAKIEQLSKEVEKLRNTVTTATANAGSSGGDPGVNVDDLKAKLEELQGRLAEYEIIEDDIADLSLFKDENARLKVEIEELRSQVANLATAAPAVVPQAVQQAPAPVPPSAPAPAPAPAPVAEAPAPAPATELKFEKTDKFELDPNDDVMKEFAAAVQIQQAPPPEISSSMEPAATKLPEPGGGQDAIDAMFASASGEAEPAAHADSQLEVDQMLAQAEADAIARGVIPPRTPEPIPEPLAPHPAEAAASAIEAMLASARGGADIEADLLPPSNDPDDFADPMPSIDDLLAEASDTDKMLSEVESIESQLAATAPVSNPLEEALDTDKLLAELEAERTGGVVPAPATSAAPVASAAPPPAAQPVAHAVTPPVAPAIAQPAAPAAEPAAHSVTGSTVGDDLLAEFKDETRKG